MFRYSLWISVGTNIETVPETVGNHMEHMCHFHLNIRYQKPNESLQEFETDIARLARRIPSDTENIIERLVVHGFLDGLRNHKTKQALILARSDKLVDTLCVG